MPTLSAALAILAKADCPLLLIGGNALQAFGLSRPTFDVDCMVAVPNKARLREVLEKADFHWQAEFASFQEFRFQSRFDTPPIHVMHVDGSTFDAIWESSIEHAFDGNASSIALSRSFNCA